MIYAGLATIPEREHLLEKVIDSIAPQVDRLYISLNGYSSCPEFYNKYLEGGVVFMHLWNNKLGDAEKFRLISKREGYLFTMDDDLIYPSNYVKTLINHIERYNRKCVITIHGRTFKRSPIISYYRGKLTGYHWDVNQDFDIEVNSGGTGVMAWHSDTIKIKYKEIKRANCADVWMSVFARRAGVKIMCVKHKQGWLKYVGPKEDLTNPKTIWSRYINSINHDLEITDIYNDGC